MRNRTVRIIVLWVVAGLFVFGGVGTYIMFKPHRDVSDTEAFAELSVSDLVQEFDMDPARANAKYLATDGNSKVLVVKGIVSSVTENEEGEVVILLKGPAAKVGTVASFPGKTSEHARTIRVGEFIKVKGAIVSGSSYDKDLDLFEDAVLVQCDIIE